MKDIDVTAVVAIFYFIAGIFIGYFYGKGRSKSGVESKKVRR